MEIGNEDQPAFKILLSCPTGLSPSQVSVDFGEVYDRIPHPDVNLENSISEIWGQRVEKNASLFNGLKFRYGGFNFSGGGGSDQEPHVCLHLGLTDYRTFVGTNLNPLWERFLLPSEDDCRQCQHTSSPLGNGAVIETSDKKILVLQRSNNVGEFPGHYVFPGGHPEPEEIGILSRDARDANSSEIMKKKLSQEMFDSIIREVVEEIGVPVDNLAAFPAQEKRLDALILCTSEIFMYIEENLKLTPQSMSDKVTAADELEEMHQQKTLSSAQQLTARCSLPTMAFIRKPFLRQNRKAEPVKLHQRKPSSNGNSVRHS